MGGLNAVDQADLIPGNPDECTDRRHSAKLVIVDYRI
jgi:hypothetical protein